MADYGSIAIAGRAGSSRTSSPLIASGCSSMGGAVDAVLAVNAWRLAIQHDRSTAGRDDGIDYGGAET